MTVAIDCMFLLLGLIIIIKNTATGLIRSLISFCKVGACIFASYVLTPMIFPHSSSGAAVLLVYLLVFLGAYILITLIEHLLDRIFSLPVLSTANKLGGFVLGIVCAYVALSVVAAALTVVAVYSDSAIFGMTQKELSESTQVYRFFDSFGILNFLSLKIQIS